MNDPTLPLAAGAATPDTATALERFDRRPPSPSPEIGDAPGAIHGAYSAVGSFREHARLVLAKEQELRDDTRLSDEGRHAKLVDFAEEQILALGRTAESARLAVRGLLDKTKLPTIPDIDDLGAGTRELARETRELLRSMKDHERSEALRIAANTGDTVTMLAFAHAPGVAPLAPQSALDEATQRHLERQAPEAFRHKRLADEALARLDEAEKVIGMIRQHHQTKFRSAKVAPKASKFPKPHHPPVAV